MAILITCGVCERDLSTPDESAGELITCENCHTQLRVPGPTPVPIVKTSSSEHHPEESQPELLDSVVAHPTEPEADRAEPRRARPRRRRPPPPSGRSTLFWIVLIMLLLGLVTASGVGALLWVLRPQWRMHESVQGQFRVELPASPRSDMKKMAGLDNDPTIKVEGTILFSKLEAFVIAYTDFDPDKRLQMNDDEILDESIKGMLEEFPGSRKLREQPVTVSGFPAREVVVDTPHDGTMVARVIVAEKKFYVVIGGGRWASPDSPRIRRYLDSFEVIRK